METIKKYELLQNDTINIDGHVLYRIKSLTKFVNVKVGDLGGYIEKEANLSHDGNCWAYNDSCIYGNAKVYDNACICWHAQIYDNAHVFEEAMILDNAKIFENAMVFDHAIIFDNVKIFGEAKILGPTVMHDTVEAFGKTVVDYGLICGDAVINDKHTYLSFNDIWSANNKHFTWTQSNNMWCISRECLTEEEFIKNAYQNSEIDGKCCEATVNYVKRLKSIIDNKNN